MKPAKFSHISLPRSQWDQQSLSVRPNTTLSKQYHVY